MIQRNADTEAYLLFSRVANKWRPPLITEYVLNPNNVGQFDWIFNATPLVKFTHVWYDDLRLKKFDEINSGLLGKFYSY